MKSILITSIAMEIGGSERALIGLLDSLDTEEYQVDLFLMRHSGDFFKYIPKEINILPEIKQYSCIGVPISIPLKHREWGIILGRIYAKIIAWLKNRFLMPSEGKEYSGIELELSHKYCLKFLPEISEKEYDLVVSYLTPHYIARWKAKGKKYIARVCTDYSKITTDKKSETSMWNAYDGIFANSEETAHSFSHCFPSLKSKVNVIENCLPQELIKNLSRKAVDDPIEETAEVVLLSVGRFVVAKNFDNIPNICKLIINMGINIKWYLIGFGGMEKTIINEIEKNDVKENVIIIGKRINPYPYIKQCDIYVQPSAFEGKSNAVIEAQIMGKPVIITDYPSAGSQIEDGVDGIIVPMDNEGCAKGIVDFIKNKDLQKRVIENMTNRDYSNKDEAQKLYSFMGV